MKCEECHITYAHNLQSFLCVYNSVCCSENIYFEIHSKYSNGTVLNKSMERILAHVLDISTLVLPDGTENEKRKKIILQLIDE